MICNGKALIFSEPIKNMLHTKECEHGVSYGLAEPARYTGKYQGQADQPIKPIME